MADVEALRGQWQRRPRAGRVLASSYFAFDNWPLVSERNSFGAQLVQVVPPVDPGVAAAADVQLVLDPVLLQHLRQAFEPATSEVLVADADREQLDRLVDLVGVLRGTTRSASPTRSAFPPKRPALQIPT